MTLYNRIDLPEVIELLFPSPCASHCPPPSYAEDVSFEVAHGLILNCRFYLADQNAPVLFLFPATANSLHSFDVLAEDYIKQGMNIFLASYRGCGQNCGSPSVGAVYADSEILFDLGIKWLNSKGFNGPVFVMGQSLGTIAAIDTVSKNADSIKGLILESSICETGSFLEALGAGPKLIDFSEEEGFNTLKKIEKIKNPTLIFHGARDRLVAIAEAEKIQASSGARTKQFFVIPGAEHHTVGETGGLLYIKAIKQFTDTVCGVNTWRQNRRDLKKKRSEGQQKG
jgi:hypothetical protein